MSDTLTVKITAILGDGSPITSEHEYLVPTDAEVTEALHRMRRTDPTGFGQIMQASSEMRRLMGIPEYAVTESTWTAPGGSFAVINGGSGPLDVTMPAECGSVDVVMVAPGNMMLWLCSDLGGSP